MNEHATWRRLAEAGHAATLDELDFARTALTDPDADTRQLAIGALERAGQLSEPDLAAAMADPHPAVRRRSALVVATRPGTSLLTLLSDPDSTVIEAAAWAAGEHVDVSATVLERLIDLAGGHDDPLVREAAIAALGAIGDERGLPAILAGCSDKPAVRRRAVLALAPFDTPEVHAALAAARHDRDWQVRQAADDLS